MEIHAKPMCLFCQKTISCPRRANLRRYYEYFHPEFKDLYPLHSDVWRNSKHRSMGLKLTNPCFAAMLKSSDIRDINLIRNRLEYCKRQ